MPRDWHRAEMTKRAAKAPGGDLTQEPQPPSPQIVRRRQGRFTPKLRKCLNRAGTAESCQKANSRRS
jgi:hypothetical protein